MEFSFEESMPKRDEAEIMFLPYGLPLAWRMFTTIKALPVVCLSENCTFAIEVDWWVYVQIGAAQYPSECNACHSILSLQSFRSFQRQKVTFYPCGCTASSNIIRHAHNRLCRAACSLCQIGIFILQFQIAAICVSGPFHINPGHYLPYLM